MICIILNFFCLSTSKIFRVDHMKHLQKNGSKNAGNALLEMKIGGIYE